jgi:hypothetical protein
LLARESHKRCRRAGVGMLRPLKDFQANPNFLLDRNRRVNL